MIVAVSKITRSGVKSKRYIDTVQALYLLDTDKLNLVCVPSESLLKALKGGTIHLENITVEQDDLKETSLVANNAKPFGDKAKRIIFKYNDIIVVSTKTKPEVMKLNEATAADIESSGLTYDIRVYGGRQFKATDINYITFPDETPLSSEELEEIFADGSMETTEDIEEEQVVKTIDMDDVKRRLEKHLENEEDTDDTEEFVSVSEIAKPKLEELENIGEENCPICRGKGRYQSGMFGLLLTCECVARKKERLEAEAAKKRKAELVYTVTGAQKIQAVAEKLIPESRKEDEFSDEITRQNVMSLYGSRNGSLRSKDFKEYTNLLNGIIASISLGNPLNMSYMIGAPNGFGKTTFANTCIKRLYAKGKKAVPYKSLLEIAALRDEYIRELGKQYKKSTVKNDNEDNYEYEERTYTWDDYCKAEVAFCYLTTPENGWVEMSTLKALVTIRATNGLATIVMMDSSLQVYRANNDIRKYILDDIIAPDKEHGALDRLVHQSVFIIYRTGINAVAGKDF